MIKLGCGDEGEGYGAGEAERAVVVVCALMHSLAGTASLPCTLHLKVAIHLVWRCLSA